MAFRSQMAPRTQNESPAVGAADGQAAMVGFLAVLTTALGGIAVGLVPGLLSVPGSVALGVVVFGVWAGAYVAVAGPFAAFAEWQGVRRGWPRWVILPGYLITAVLAVVLIPLTEFADFGDPRVLLMPGIPLAVLGFIAWGLAGAGRRWGLTPLRRAAFVFTVVLGVFVAIGLAATA